MDEVSILKVEIAMLKDLLETAYRKVDAARRESEKADDEALHYKTVAALEDKVTARRNYEAIYGWKRRAEAAEAKLAGLNR